MGHRISVDNSATNDYMEVVAGSRSGLSKEDAGKRIEHAYREACRNQSTRPRIIDGYPYVPVGIKNTHCGVFYFILEGGRISHIVDKATYRSLL
jgi:hypothetical protein